MIFGLPAWNWFLFFFIYIPIVILWVSVVIDLFSRPDLGGWAKVGWLAFVLILPLIGSLIYLGVRPTEAEEITRAQEKKRAA